MKKNIKKIILILTIIMCLINIMQTISFAGFSISDVITHAKNFPGSDSKIEEKDMKDMQAVIYNILLVIGVIVAVIGTAIMGIQFITSAPEGKAEVKEKMVPFVIGCIVVFSGMAIWKFAVNTIQKVAI